MPFPYAEFSFEERLKLSRSIKEKYPNHFPILVDIIGRQAARRKYLVPDTATLSQLLRSIRRENTISEYEAIFIHSNNYMLSPSQNITEVYSRHAHGDGFLYITVSFENTFG